MGCGKLGFPQFEKRERKSPKPELLLPCPGTEAGMDINFPERFLLFLSLEPGSSLSLFHHFCDCCYHCSLFAFVLTEQTLKGYFVRMSPTTSAAQDEFSFILFFFLWLHQVLVGAPRIFSYGTWNLVPGPGTEPRLPALGAWSLSHWTTREVPEFYLTLIQI